MIEQEVTRLCDGIRLNLEEWSRESGKSANTAENHERLGKSAASEKRIGIAYHKLFKDEKKYIEAYQNSYEFYKKAVAAKPGNQWVITQYLSMRAILRYFRDNEEECRENELARLWRATLEINQWQLPRAEGIERVWSNATLAELKLLGVVYGGETFDKEAAKKEIIDCCKKIAELCEPDDFPLESTSRQFFRYTDIWDKEEWKPLAQAALIALGK